MSELPEDFNNYEQRFGPYYNERLKNTDQLKMKLENLTRDKSYEDNKSSVIAESNKGNIFEMTEEQQWLVHLINRLWRYWNTLRGESHLFFSE